MMISFDSQFDITKGQEIVCSFVVIELDLCCKPVTQSAKGGVQSKLAHTKVSSWLEENGCEASIVGKEKYVVSLVLNHCLWH